ncbi:hypothetical protein [Catellatospora sichuanensis]|uniref:hypothetical protein n=1 Tax=Catellatospora sichuanensis TaxID=1969805 RepID=UPI0011826B26|nr:hypothetical protein [Catellatospora sichuanensis]
MGITPAHVRRPLYAALRDGRTPLEDQEALAANWLRAQPGSPMILVSAIRDFGNSTLADDFPRTAVEKLGRHTSVSHRGPLLVAWPAAENLSQLQHADEATAICVIEGGDVLQQPWLRAQRAIDLATGERLESRSDLVSAVVAVALKSLVPKLNGLSSSFDRPTVIDALCHLKAGGYEIDPAGVYEFALQAGAEGDEALLMHEVANGLRKGHNYRRSQRLKPEIVRRWESEAAALTDLP